ncbi:hypothetical protein DL764_008056 [Monosporascus ibericus]|uniref:GH16 domain-containing protein n=1 Tax=Monosporascus ibericus TaxID=155417 RepID=A0A4Q4T192_9PEZI|nr:hypothetical protein DL764_008056 [Monosporascus ibericus]
MAFTKVLRFTSLCALVAAAQAAYSIRDSYNKTNFFQGFEFYSGPDPTQGFVNYQTAFEANAASLAGYANDAVYLGVDSGAPNPVGGRASTRVNTKNKYTKGLFIADIAHMPSSTCGVWAAYWSFGDGWPGNGEIDIIEGVNRNRSSTYTLHTSEGCSFQQGDCNSPGDGTQGCSNPHDETQLYGDAFNEIGGGIYATEWTSQAIRFWFFPRTGAMPQDIAAESPNPNTWGAPAATFSGPGCSIDQHFKEHQIVFNTALCGQWAGRVFGSDPVCASQASTCEEFVAANPERFREAYWLINSLKIYQQDGGNMVRDASVPKQFKA